MAATTIANILVQVRRQLVEVTAKYWSDTELIDIFKLGVTDLWGAVLDLHQDHYMTVVEDGSCKLSAGLTRLSGVPDDCFRVLLIEPLSTTSCIEFLPKKYTSREFREARGVSTSDVVTNFSSGVIYYDVTGPGAPVAAPIIRVAPVVSTDLSVRLVYCPMLAVNDVNPVPGGSDNALKAWTISYAMAKEGPFGQRIPDPGWLAVYGTEKQTILTRLTPRQEQEPDTVEGLFGG